MVTGSERGSLPSQFEILTSTLLPLMMSPLEVLLSARRQEYCCLVCTGKWRGDRRRQGSYRRFTPVGRFGYVLWQWIKTATLCYPQTTSHRFLASAPRRSNTMATIIVSA